MNAGTPRRAVAPLAGSVLAVTLLALTVLAGCSRATGPDSATNQSDRTVATGNTLDEKLPDTVTAARLVDQDGTRFSLRSLRGRTVVLAPLLTLCQETCPMTSANIHAAAEAAQRSRRSQRVVFLEITVDPARDTVRRLHAYAHLYGAVPQWRLATGQPDQIRALWRSLGVSTARAPSHEPVRDWLTGRLLEHSYDVHHQDVVLVIDASGRLRWLTVGRPDARRGRLPATLRGFLNKEGRHNLDDPGGGGASSWTAQDVEHAVRFVRSHGRAGAVRSR